VLEAGRADRIGQNDSCRNRRASWRVRRGTPVFSPPPRQDGKLEYKNLLLRFDLLYPQDLQVYEYDDGTSASTITFEDAKGERGFQIFVVPYAQDQITDAQFKKDEPSGVMREPTDVLLDGVRATAFFGNDAKLGDTRGVVYQKRLPLRGLHVQRARRVACGHHAHLEIHLIRIGVENVSGRLVLYS
jgi:hypothetical protein